MLISSVHCASTRIGRVGTPAATTVKEKRLFFLLFGVIDTDRSMDLNSLCAPNNFAAATYSYNALDVGISVLTVGLVIPQSLKVECL